MDNIDEDPQLKQMYGELSKNWGFFVKGECDDNQFKQYLTDFFGSIRNPYKKLLYFLERIGNFSTSPNPLSFPCKIITFFTDWVKDRKQLKAQLTYEVKTKSFILGSNYTVFYIKKLLFQLYHLDSNPEILRLNQDLLFTNQMFYQLSHWVMLFNDESIPKLKFLVPMLLLEQFDHIMFYLKERKADQLSFTKELDEILRSFSSRQKYLEELHTQYGVFLKKEKMVKFITLRKFFNKLIKNFNISLDEVPFTKNTYMQQHLVYLFRCWLHHEVGDEAFRERVIDISQGDVKYISHVIKLLRSKGEITEAVYWNEKYNMNFPIEGTGSKRKPLNMEFFSVPGLSAMTEMVDGGGDMSRLLDRLNRGDCRVVGFDAEWKPSHTPIENPPSLLQLAFSDRVFIIDLLTVDGNEQTWEKLNKALFAEKSILKIGYGCKSDSSKFAEKKNLSFIKLSGPDYLDMNTVERKLIPYVAAGKVKYPFELDDSTLDLKGLQRLSALCCGKPLDKRETISNWERRPLRASQVIYAALDAFVLLEIYEKTKQMVVTTLGFQNFKEFLSAEMNAIVLESAQIGNKTKKKNKNRRKRSNRKRSGTNNTSPRGDAPNRCSNKNNEPSKPSATSVGDSDKVPKKKRKPLRIWALCNFCFEFHNYGKCSNRIGYLSFIDAVVMGSVDMLSNEVIPLFDTLWRSLNKIVSDFPPFEGELKFSGKALLFPVAHGYTFNFIKRPVLKKILSFVEKCFNYLARCDATVFSVGDRSHELHCKHPKSSCNREMGKSCSFCLYSESVKEAVECLNSLKIGFKQVSSELTDLECCFSEHELKFQVCSVEPSLKPVLKEYRCSCCYKFGHCDLFCAIKKSLLSESIDYLENSFVLVTKYQRFLEFCN